MWWKIKVLLVLADVRAIGLLGEYIPSSINGGRTESKKKVEVEN